MEPEHVPAPLTRSIPRGELHIEPRLNVRQFFDRLDDLAASIREHGLIEPLVVRPRAAGGYEVGGGARRLRAAEIGKVPELLCVVRDLSDRQMVEMSLVENGDRADLHPLEEAEAFWRLHFGWKGLGLDAPVPLEEIAATVHQTRGYVRGRLRLRTDLDEEVRAAFAGMRFKVAGALAFLQVASKATQRKVYAEVTAGRSEKDPIEAVAIARLVRSKYQLRMVDARFPKKDATLVEAAGACTDCPKRTRNAPELFEGAKPEDDACTDPDCFALKKDTWAKRVTARAEAEGRLLDEGEWRKAFKGGATANPGAVAYDSPWLALDAECYEDPKLRTWKDLLGKKAPPSKVAVDPAGWPRDVVARADAVEALRKLGESALADDVARFGDEGEKKEADAARRKKLREEGEALRGAVDATLLQVGKAGAASWKALSRPTLRALVAGVVELSWNDDLAAYVRRHELDDAGGQKGMSRKDRVKQMVLAHVGAMAERELVGALCELVASRDALAAADKGAKAKPELRAGMPFWDVATSLRVDHGANRVVARKAARAKAPKEAPAKKAAKRAKRAKK
jgi:ParB/RepB/Spo0J family partition protein